MQPATTKTTAATTGADVKVKVEKKEMQDTKIPDVSPSLFINMSSCTFLQDAMRAAYLKDKRMISTHNEKISARFMNSIVKEVIYVDQVDQLSHDALKAIGVECVKNVKNAPTPPCYMTVKKSVSDDENVYRIYHIREDIDFPRISDIKIIPDYAFPHCRNNNNYLINLDIKRIDASVEVKTMLGELHSLMTEAVVVRLTTKESGNHREAYKSKTIVTARTWVRFYLYAFDRIERLCETAKGHEELYGLPYGISLLCLHIMYLIAQRLENYKSQMKHVYCRKDNSYKGGIMITWRGKTTGENLRQFVYKRLETDTFENIKRVRGYQATMVKHAQRADWSSLMFLKKRCVTFGNIENSFAQTTPIQDKLNIDVPLVLSLNSIDYLTRQARNNMVLPKPSRIQLLPPLNKNIKKETPSTPRPSASALPKLLEAPTVAAEIPLPPFPEMNIHKRSLDVLLEAANATASASSSTPKRAKREHDKEDEDTKSQVSEVYDINPDFGALFGNQDAFFQFSPLDNTFPFPEEKDEEEGPFIFDTDDSDKENVAPLDSLSDIINNKKVSLLDLFKEERYDFDDGEDYNVV